MGRLPFMGQAQRPTCPDCGAPLIMALPADGKGKRALRCVECDRPDPLKDPQTVGWLAGELGRNEPSKTS
jgi:hypothetical protein